MVQDYAEFCTLNFVCRNFMLFLDGESLMLVLNGKFVFSKTFDVLRKKINAEFFAVKVFLKREQDYPGGEELYSL